MPSKKETRNYKKEYQRKLELLGVKDGALDAERERLKHAQRKRRTDPDVKKRDRADQRRRMQDTERLAKHRKYYKSWRNKRVLECRAIIHEWKQQGCCVCGETSLCCIDAHHKDQEEKEYNIGALVYGSKPLTAIPKELAKCIPICANCHRKYHAGEDKKVVNKVVSITGQPWSPIKGGKKQRKEMGRRGPFGKPIYEEDE